MPEYVSWWPARRASTAKQKSLVFIEYPLLPGTLPGTSLSLNLVTTRPSGPNESNLQKGKPRVLGSKYLSKVTQASELQNLLGSKVYVLFHQKFFHRKRCEKFETLTPLCPETAVYKWLKLSSKKLVSMKLITVPSHLFLRYHMSQQVNLQDREKQSRIASENP